MQTLLCTWKGAMQTLLRTWTGDIVSETKKALNCNIFKIYNYFFLNAYVYRVYMTYVTTFDNENSLRESTFK